MVVRYGVISFLRLDYPHCLQFKDPVDDVIYMLTSLDISFWRHCNAISSSNFASYRHLLVICDFYSLQILGNLFSV